MRTLVLREAAAFLKIHPEELRRRAKLGQIPGARWAAPGCSSRMILSSTCARSMLALGKRCK